MLLCFLLFLPGINSQASQWYDTFQKTLCRDRWAQMDWQSILRPCRFNLQFGQNKYEKRDRTSPKWSHTLGLHFKKTGEFSKLGIQSRTGDGHNKNIGGDTWRVFIRGADSITPFVSDLNNGVYEAKFIALNPGFYKAEIVLQSTLCESFKDPPQDWLKRDAQTIINDEVDAKPLWTPLRGGNISFKIEDSSADIKQNLKRSFRRWKDSCGQQYTCNLLWKGFGRWTNSTWVPYIDDGVPKSEVEGRCLNEGILKISGDDFSQEVFQAVNKSSLCNGNIFARCIGTTTDEQPDAKSFIKRKKSARTFSTKLYLNSLKNLLKKPEMDEKSALLLNYGHSFVQNMAFKKYRLFIDRAVKILKEKYKGKAIWRTMTSNWRDAIDPDLHFQNHQRIQLFNAYATSAMCNAGIPVLDVFQMSESVPWGNKTAVVDAVQHILTEYFNANHVKQCDTESSDIEADTQGATLTNATVTQDHQNTADSPSALLQTDASLYISPPNPTFTENPNVYLGGYTPLKNLQKANIRTSKSSHLKLDVEYDTPFTRKRSLTAE